MSPTQWWTWDNFRQAGADRLILVRVLETRSLLRQVAKAMPGADITVIRLRVPLARSSAPVPAALRDLTAISTSHTRSGPDAGSGGKSPRALHLIVLAVWGVATSRPAARFISRDRRE
jgi:hypothetical protein